MGRSQKTPISPSLVPYAELHCHSHFSFLDGASSPESLVGEATRLGLEALALTDHNGFYGVVRFAQAARQVSLPTIFGAELSFDRATSPSGQPDPGTDEGESHLVALARNPNGYAQLARIISDAQLRGEKGIPRLDFTQFAESLHRPDDLFFLTGCRKGRVPQALERYGPTAALNELQQLCQVVGRQNIAIELWDHGHPLDSARNDALVAVAHQAGVEVVATTNAHYATLAERPLATAVAAVRSRRSLDELDPWLPAGAGAHLRSGAEQKRRFARYPGVVERAHEIGMECAFDLSLVAPDLPPYPCPSGHDEMSYLRALTEQGAQRRYGPRHRERVKGAWKQIDHELDVIEKLNFPGYFLIVHDLVEFCRRNDIYCQGRGSAANSAVCFALGVTKADAVSLGLLFERFLSVERDGPPDIDIDIESQRREEVIQYVFQRYGRHYAAQVANVITYRPRSAVREMATALGYAPGQADAWAKIVDRRGSMRAQREDKESDAIPALVLDLATQIEHSPRHLGIHSGGMVLCDRPIIEVCPVEWARREGRTVLQWDKDDCAAAGLVKFDLLGLGMLTALHNTVDLVADAHGFTIDIAELPQDDAVYDMLCAADSVGVFQVESRAQMATLPRLKPRTFYDLVIEVALIRPGPIQGGSVHPYLRRRNGVEEVTYLHPLLEPSLAKTLGVPLFQEQLMQIAIDAAGFSPGEADELRQAMGSKRSGERMERLRERLYNGMQKNGIVGSVADDIYEKLAAFANFGFPESHSVSFAYLVYASSYLKRYFPAAFCAGLLNAQPMGFYSPHSLITDARRHGVDVATPDIQLSQAQASLQADTAMMIDAYPRDGVSITQPTVRLGLSSVRHIGDDVAELIVEEREANGPFTSLEEFTRRVTVSSSAMEALATAGAFSSLPQDLDRRKAIWVAGAVASASAQRLPGIVVGLDAPPLPKMSKRDIASADLWATGMAPDGHPTLFERDHLKERGVLTAAQLRTKAHGEKVVVGGVVTHRQQPSTARGITFLNLEDETGFVNIVCSPGLWKRYRKIARQSPALIVRGRLEKVEGVINVVAEKIELLPVLGSPHARNFR